MPISGRGLLLTGVAMLCFAANSLLCRMALASGLIDAASFTTVRVVTAAAMLTAIVWFRLRHLPRLANASAPSVASLLGYLVFFSFAYVSLGAGTGALILFGAVQFTMFAVALKEGERFGPAALGGLAFAVCGLVYLLLPGLSAPDPLGAALMVLAGISWGLFSLFARGAEHPLEANACNFLFCIPAVAVINLMYSPLHASAAGLALAAASGAAASGLGYMIWYMALRHLTAGRAATVQLSVPAIAALGGVALLAEPLTPRLLIASVAMLGGIAIVLSRRNA